jgi:hypothetical protein
VSSIRSCDSSESKIPSRPMIATTSSHVTTQGQFIKRVCVTIVIRSHLWSRMSLREPAM